MSNENQQVEVAETPVAAVSPEVLAELELAVNQR